MERCGRAVDLVRRGVAIIDDGRVEATCRTDGLLARVTRECLDGALYVLFLGGGGFVAFFLDGLRADLLLLGGEVVVVVAMVGGGGVEELGGIVMRVGRSTRRRLLRARRVFDDRGMIWNLDL
jgi:hypothetical protein